MPLADSLAKIAPTFTGQLLQPLDTGYEEARRVHNGLVDKRPGLIARCRGVADVVEAVQLARAEKLEIAVRGGSHNIAGRAVIDHGIMIDLAPMKGIFVYPAGKIAHAQGGVLWREFNRETQVHGLATTGGVVSTTGIAGLTLGGGLGWLMSKHGLALDNLRAADLVMADGRLMRASRGENPDLFWAIRGGGGNFGIATSLEYNLHQVGPIVTGGVVLHPLQKATEVLNVLPRAMREAPDDMVLFGGPADRAGRHQALRAFWLHISDRLRPQEAAVKPSQGIRSSGHGRHGADSVSGLNSMLDPSLPGGRTQLLEGALPDRSQRWRDQGPRRSVRGGAFAHEPDRGRVFPRRVHAPSGSRTRHARCERRGSASSCCRSGASRRTTRSASAGARHLRGAEAVSRDDALHELPGTR